MRLICRIFGLTRCCSWWMRRSIKVVDCLLVWLIIYFFMVHSDLLPPCASYLHQSISSHLFLTWSTCCQSTSVVVVFLFCSPLDRVPLIRSRGSWLRSQFGSSSFPVSFHVRDQACDLGPTTAQYSSSDRIYIQLMVVVVALVNSTYTRQRVGDRLTKGGGEE